MDLEGRPWNTRSLARARLFDLPHPHEQRRRRRGVALRPLPSRAQQSSQTRSDSFVVVVSIDAAVANVVLASCVPTFRMDDEGRWIDSNLILRELQAPQTSRAQLRQW